MKTEAQWMMSYRVRAWWDLASGDVPVGILLVAADEECLCIALALDKETRRWSAGVSRFDPDAFDAEGHVLVRGMDMEDGTELINWLGFPTNDESSPTMVFAALAGSQSMRQPVGIPVPNDTSHPFDTAFRNKARALGYIASMPTSRLIALALEDPIRRTPEGSKPTCRRVGVVEPRQRWTSQACSICHEWIAFGQYLLLTSEMPFLAGRLWSNDLYAHHATPGPFQAYRRQAADLYPILSPLLANEPRVRDLIDAARPYEEEVCRVLDEWLMPLPGRGFTVAKLRRLRRMPCGARAIDDLTLLKLACDLPLERMWLLHGESSRPDDMVELWQWAGRLGLDCAPLVRAMPQATGKEMLSQLSDATDMAVRFLATMVKPVVPGTAFSLIRVAARMLFNGTLRSALSLSAAWHARMESFEHAMPEGEDLVTWPVLFEPFERDDVRVVCLTRQSELRAEGRSVADKDGVPGLGHCVGGYGLTCYEGSSFVASVRTMEDGRWVRLSTLQLYHDPAKGIEVVQHRGQRNSAPHVRAWTALYELKEAVRRGEVVLSRDALRRRDPKGFMDGVDYTKPEVRREAWDAWAPFLPKGMARMGPDGAAEFARRLAVMPGLVRKRP